MNSNSAMSWEQYLILERNFIEYLNYVPLSPSHYNVWSFQLGSLLIDIGSVVDSFFKNSIFSTRLDHLPEIQEIRKHNLKMPVYRDVFENFSGLSSKSVYELRNTKKLFPFEEWKMGKAPFWWDSYNKVKHDRFKNHQKATLKSTLYALCGLFLLNVVYYDTISYLIDIDVVKTMGTAKGRIKDLLNEERPMKEFGYWNPYAKTDLFGYIVPIEGRTLSEDDEIGLLSPLNQGYWGSWIRD